MVNRDECGVWPDHVIVSVTNVELLTRMPLSILMQYGNIMAGMIFLPFTFPLDCESWQFLWGPPIRIDTFMA